MSRRHGDDFFKTAVLPLLILNIPTFINFVLSKVIANISDTDVFPLLISNVICSIIICFIYYIHEYRRREQLRDYKKYEGRWIQYIPDSSRNIAICELRFDGNIYHFDGTNYTQGRHIEEVTFTSYRFIADKDNSFFFITDAIIENNITIKEEGFGKIGTIRENSDGILAANGYFFDVLSAGKIGPEKAMQKTFLYKLDQNLYRFFFNNTISKNKLKRMNNHDILETFSKKIIQYSKND